MILLMHSGLTSQKRNYLWCQCFPVLLLYYDDFDIFAVFFKVTASLSEEIFVRPSIPRF